VKLRTSHKFSFGIVLFCAVLSLSFFYVTSPIALQKILSLKPYSDEVTLYNSEFQLNQSNEISDFINSIPYRDNPSSSWFVDPKLKYQDTILNGNGNCSNLAFGGMYAFIQSKKQAAIIHLLKKDYRFLSGVGHMVLSVNVEDNNIVLDVVEGGIPIQNENYIDAQNFSYDANDVFTHRVLSDRKDGQNRFFTNEYLQGIVFGSTPQSEIADYFNFLNKLYVPLGNIYVEKLIYDTLSVVFGFYPNTYVDEIFFWNTYYDNKLVVFFAYLFLVSFHLLYLLVFFFILQGVVIFYIDKKKT